MAVFELKYERSASYSEGVKVDIELNVRPTKEEYQDMLDAIKTLSNIANRYVSIPKKEGEK